LLSTFTVAFSAFPPVSITCSRNRVWGRDGEHVLPTFGQRGHSIFCLPNVLW